jgi:hypothetical protein
MANPTTPKKDDETPPHLLAWQEETYHLGRGQHYQPEVPMAVDICYFVDGRHYAGELCPHGTEEYPVGWTV